MDPPEQHEVPLVNQHRMSVPRLTLPQKIYLRHAVIRVFNLLPLQLHQIKAPKVVQPRGPVEPPEYVPLVLVNHQRRRLPPARHVPNFIPKNLRIFPLLFPVEQHLPGEAVEIVREHVVRVDAVVALVPPENNHLLLRLVNARRVRVDFRRNQFLILFRLRPSCADKIIYVQEIVVRGGLVLPAEYIQGVLEHHGGVPGPRA